MGNSFFGLINSIRVTFLLLFISFNVATAQVTISDTATRHGSADATWSLNCEGNSPEVIVIVHYTGFTGVNATYNGKSSNQTCFVSGNSDNVYLFIFPSPDKGSQSVSLSITGTGSYYAEALALENVNSDNSIFISTVSNSSGTSATTTATDAGSNDMLIGGVFGSDLGTISTQPTPNPPQKKLAAAFTSPYEGEDSYASAASASKLSWNFSNNSGNSAWVTVISGMSPLPISLLNFDAQFVAGNNTVAINWSTATEIDNKLFTIEKTTDGVNYNTVATVSGAGNSDNTLYYSATDENPWGGTSYYRLKQTDFDGNSTYSQLTAVTVPIQFSVNIYPNPVINNTTLNYSADSPDPLSVKIFNPLGLAVNSYTFTNVQTGENNLEINTSSLPSGTYIMEMTNGTQVTSRRFIKQ
ncbi:MAG: T9SS type A sorting domain-containing protein [Bacteroidia bacterium]